MNDQIILWVGILEEKMKEDNGSSDALSSEDDEPILNLGQQHQQLKGSSCGKTKWMTWINCSHNDTTAEVGEGDRNAPTATRV